MEEMYKSYKCKGCSRTTILLTEEASKTIATGKYISCSHCGCKNLIKENSTSDLRDIMKARSYKRRNGAIIETG
ncbi:hypothetical protein ACQPU1_06485 [Clostridium paraputrificum]|uniref:hypothetical protein n=1 Tax=Clostridium paraputrificum TaxID=29363 RepID=UPI003D33665D